MRGSPFLGVTRLDLVLNDEEEKKDRIIFYCPYYSSTHPHKCECLSLGLLCLWEVKVHLISIKISIVWSTHTLIEPECPICHHFSLQP